MQNELDAENREVEIPFVKMQGIGNDFVVVAADALRSISAESLSLALCERRSGIGADGLLVVGPPPNAQAAYSFAMRNPDGTPDMCGNGMRCAALYAYRKGMVPLDSDFLVETQDGLLACRILSADASGLAAQVQVQMAVPKLNAEQIPFTGTSGSDQVIDFELSGLSEPLVVTAVNTGSTHSVAFRNALPADKEFLNVSPSVEYLPDFPERTSLIWAVQKAPKEFAVRIWERGAGETLGCGTGACAVGVAAILTGRAEHGDRISIKSGGGSVQVEWPEPKAPVTLTGPAVWVFTGETHVSSALAKA